MRALLRSLRRRIHRLTPRGRAEARLAGLAQALSPALSAPALAPLAGRILQLRADPQGVLRIDGLPASTGHLRLALETTLAEILRPNLLPPGVVAAWISVPAVQDGLLYLHAADRRGRHRVAWSDGGLGAWPDGRDGGGLR